MSSDELANRRQHVSSLSSGSPGDDRRLAAEDRRQAALYLSATYRDDMTGALSRRHGREQMQVLVDRARRDASVLAFMFVDVDGLKGVNDAQGHDRGDALLAAVGRALRSNLRSYDVVVRYGGDEFVCALPGGTAEVAEEGLARVRAALERMVPGATISAGWAQLQVTDTIDDAIRRADADLYRQRRLGHRSARTRLSSASAVPDGQQHPSLACGECGGRVALADFVLELSDRMTRSADCPGCGATTFIQLAQTVTSPWWHPAGPAGG